MKQEYVFVIDKQGNPLMPTKRFSKVRKLIKNKQAILFLREPYTIQLLIDTKTYTQKCDVGIDPGYINVGFSALGYKCEFIGGLLKLREDVKSLLDDRRMYRKNRRGRLRHRQPRFDNRKRKEGWLSPSIQHKLDSIVKLIDTLCKILPVKKITIEGAVFDIQKLKNPEIIGVDYQNGKQKGFNNTRAFVLHRDGYKCQNPGCKNKSEKPKLEAHHILYRSNGATNSPDEYITICTMCHTQNGHQKDGFLYELMVKNKKQLIHYKEKTFMNIIKDKLYEIIENKYPDKKIVQTFGYLTREKRINNQLEKTHHNDAFCIADGDCQKICESTNINIIRRNNRSLETFRDSKWFDRREYEEKSKELNTNNYSTITSKLENKTGKTLSNGRTTRDKNQNAENLRKYRMPILCFDENKKCMVRKKITKGNRSIRKKRYEIQKGDKILILEDWNNKDKTFFVRKNQILIAGGVKNKGLYVYILDNDNKFFKIIKTTKDRDGNENEKKHKVCIPSKICSVLKSKKGFVFN